MTPRTAAGARLFVLLTVVVAGCATGSAVTTELRPDGIYHLKCKTTLQVCLNQAEVVCNDRSYAVLRAFDTHEYKGDITFPTSYRSSEAFVRCGMRGTFGTENKALMTEPLCPAPPAPASPAPVAAATGCTPGLSQACVGPGGCKGGQACARDGAGFGPCDCGGAPAAPAAPAP
jgi:hypothetical protein